MPELTIHRTPKQKQFCEAEQYEVLFGGAAGGGKSYGQLIDALLYAIRYKGSKQLILRRTYKDLERSIIDVHLGLYPKKPGYRYNASSHKGTFDNGSTIEFGYCDAESDWMQYQGAEYDVVRFDELTHFTETQYLKISSRVRGANNFPKHVKSSTNPGGPGHQWVKARFIDPAPPETAFDSEIKGLQRIFIPSMATDNTYLMALDPLYIERLKQLPDEERKAMLYGEWDLYAGQYFPEFKRTTHVVEPFAIPDNWRRYYTMDYGLDMYAAFLIAVDEAGNAYVYREIYEKDLIVSASIERAQDHFREMFDNKDYFTFLAPPDLWNRRQENGKSVVDYWYDKGIALTKTSNDRINGWACVKEFLALRKNEFGEMVPKLKVFSNCTNLIRTLPALQHDDRNPNDVADKPHELTHAPDALRGFCIYWINPAEKKRTVAKWAQDQWDDYYAASDAEQQRMIKMWGDPF